MRTLLHSSCSTRLLSAHKPLAVTAQLLPIPPCSHAAQQHAAQHTSAWQHARCSLRTNASGTAVDAPVHPAEDNAHMAIQPATSSTQGTSVGGVQPALASDIASIESVGSEPLQSFCVSSEEQEDGSVSTDSEVSSQAQAEAASLSKAAARKARRVPPTLITPHQHQLSSMSKEQLYQLFSNGALLIDKPLGWTSFDVCGKLRNTLKFLGVKKVGHAGTLDPLASGLLVVATGAGTKFCDDFMALEKEYSGIIRLGEGTDTYDAEGDVKERLPWEHITDEQIHQAAASFVGDIQQVPPMYSAIKVKGQKLYQLAREGETIDRQPRPVTITSFGVWRTDNSTHSTTSSTPGSHATSADSSAEASNDGTPGHNASCKDTAGSATNVGTLDNGTPDNGTRAGMLDNGTRAYLGVAGSGSVQGSHTGSNRPPDHPAQDVHFHVGCSKGTYIRSLAYDLGRKLGTAAHLAALRRESVGEMRVSNAWEWQELLRQLKDAKEQLLSQ